MQIPPITQRNFQDIAKAMDHPEWIEDKRFDSPEGLIQNWFELLKLINNWTQTRTTAECDAILSKVNAPYARFRTVQEAMNDPHLDERGTIASINYGAGEYRLPNAAFQISGATTHARDRVATFNQDAEEVLGGILGYTKEQIAACKVKSAEDAG